MASLSGLNATEIARLKAEGYCFEIIEPSQHKFAIGLTLHQIFVVVGGVCAIVTFINFMLVWLSHLIWRSNLPQQKQLMRILLLPVIFTICSWLSIYKYRLNVYLVTIPKIYETYAVACFYQFMLQLLTQTEDEHKREQFMVDTERQTRRKQNRIHDKGSLRWYKVRSLAVFQSPFITLLGTIAVEIIVSVMCPTSTSASVSKFAVQIFLFVSVVTALISMANIYIRFKRGELKHAKVLRKFLSFKAMIWLFIHQQLILQIITFAKAVKPTYYMSEADFAVGIPAFMILCECTIFSFIFYFSLSALPYRPSAQIGITENTSREASPDATVSAYLVSFVFPIDIVAQTWRAMKTFAGLFKGQRNFDYTGGTGISWNQRFHDQTTSYEPYAQKYSSGSESNEP